MAPLPIFLTFVAVPYLHLTLLGVADRHALAAAAIFTTFLAILMVVWRARLLRWFGRLLRPVEQVGARHWIMIVLGVGIFLRIGWVIVFNTPLRSDFAIYFDLARGLVERGRYGGEGSYQAYWPPGLPLFLAPFLALFGPQTWIPLLGNLLLTSLTILFTSRLAMELQERMVARMAPLLVAVWPSSVMSAGLASKEQLLLPLVTGAVLFYLRSGRNGRGANWIYLALTGGLIGFATLTQPSFILLPAVILLAEALSTGRLWRPLRHTLVVAFGTALIISPWIWRNYRVFGQFVLISTNGGDVLYRANNPLATGTYTERGEIELQGMEELERNRLGGQLAREWIRENPGQFLRLAFRKQMAYLGDDNMGAYETLRRGLGIGGPTLLIGKMISSGYWLLIWALILLGWLKHRAIYQLPHLAIPLLIVIYQLAIDSLYESGSRHHVPLSGLLALLAAIPFSRGRVEPAGEEPLT